MGLKRRSFMQVMGLAFAALGVSQTSLFTLTQTYNSALAGETGRKLALLVGIDHYGSDLGPPLTGCVTDVQLQRQLLVHRYGFDPKDVLTLTDQAATWEGIVSAVQTHLIDQAAANDLVTFHFSGYGSRVRKGEVLVKSLVPVDSTLPTATAPQVRDLLEETLWSLLSLLPTRQVLVVLDTSYSDPGTGTQLRSRTRANPDLGVIHPQELEFQKTLPAHPQSQPLVLQASTLTGGPRAYELQGHGFSAGLFTYALTQGWWQGLEPDQWWSQVQAQVYEWAGPSQQPSLSLPPFDPWFRNYPGADGVVLAIEEPPQSAKVWLGGLPLPVLETYAPGSVLSTLPGNSQPAIPVQVRSREGLVAKVKVLNSTDAIYGGDPLQELVRAIPRKLGLSIALDNSLDRIERVDATSAFASIPYVSSVVAEDQPADYRFGRAQAPTAVQLQVASLPVNAIASTVLGDLSLPPQGYGLYSLHGGLMSQTVGDRGEVVKAAVHRLTPHLQELLAHKLLYLVCNSNASRVGIQATLQQAGSPPQTLSTQVTTRSPDSPSLPPTPPTNLILPKAKGNLQVQVHNFSSGPIYPLLIGTTDRGVRVYPARGEWRQLPEVPPDQALTLPLVPNSPDWVSSQGWTELQLVCSCAPMTKIQALLAAPPRGFNPLELVQALLEDLHQSSLMALETSGLRDLIPPENFALALNGWASFRFLYQVS